MPRQLAPTRERNNDYFTLRNRSLADAHRAREADDARETERQNALRLLAHPSTKEWEEAEASSLPILATAGDVREVVQYLKRKPSGVSIVEAMDDARRRLFEPRKIAAYEFWGIVERPNGDRLKLSALGWDFARKLEPEAEAYRGVLVSIAPYRDALRWMHERDEDLVTFVDVAAYWREHHGEVLGRSDERTAEATVVCFFHLCQAAELGTMTIGKRGQPARLRIERDELTRYVEDRQQTPQHASSHKMVVAHAGGREAVAVSNTSTDINASNVNQTAVHASDFDAPTPTTVATNTTAVAVAAERLRLFISTRTDAPIVAQILAALELAGLESNIARRLETDDVPVGQEVFQAMHRSNAALFVVTTDDGRPSATGEWILDQNLLVAIGAAFVLYKRRVLLVWNAPLPLPAHLNGLACFAFDADHLTWEQSVGLMKAITRLRDDARSDDRDASLA